MFKRNALLIRMEGGKSTRITLILLWNVTHAVITGQMVPSAAQGMVGEVHTHRDSLTRSAADGIH